MIRMNDLFTYEWKEVLKTQKLSVKTFIQIMVLSFAVGLIPGILFADIRHETKLGVYCSIIMVFIIPVTVIFLLLKDNGKKTGISTLSMCKDNIMVSRHVISGTGRYYYAVWDLMEAKMCKIDWKHQVIQMDGKWEVTAYAVKKGGNPGRFIDSDIRSYTQTFQLPKEKFEKAVECLAKWGYPIMKMTHIEYDEAVPFIRRHYGS